MTSWKIYKLGDVATITTGFPFKGDLYSKNGIRVLRGENIGDEELRWDGHRDKRWNLPFERINEYSLQDGDVILAMDGNVGKNKARITDKDLPMLIAQRVACIRANTLSDQKFLYYAIISRAFQQYLDSVKTGTTIQHISMKQIAEYEISLPPLEEQRRIAGILGAIDDKIENNRRINTNLELQAQALYKQWFVDNRSDDWEEKQLSEIALHITDGVHNTVIDSPEGEYYLLSCKNIKSGQLLIGSNERRIDRETFAKLRKRTRLSQGDILVTSVGTVGEMYLVNESPSNYEFQRSVAIIKPNNDIISSYFLYAALLYQQNEIKHLAHGAVQQCIFISDLKEYSFIVPNKNDISAFDEVVAPMFNKIGELQKENEALATLRDTLLPKLMNGKIKIVE